MSTSTLLLKWFRTVHRLIGAFTAPALVFFAVSGALQTFNFHDTAKDGSYVPPTWIAALARIHKKQTAAVPPKKATAAADAVVQKAVPTPPAAASAPSEPLPMKMFFLIVATGLLLSALSGVYMSYRFTRSRALTTALLIAGIVVPVAMLLVT